MDARHGEELRLAALEAAAAEPYAPTAVTIRARALGPGHVAVAADKAAHPAIVDALGEHDQAATAFLEAIDTFERVLGPDHHEVAVNLNNLAAVRQRQGRLDEAERLYGERSPQKNAHSAATIPKRRSR